MILIYNGAILATPDTTQKGFQTLIATLQHAREKWIQEGRPDSGAFM